MPTPLRPYAQSPARLILQIVADLAALAWTALWVWVAVGVHAGLLALASAGFRLRDGAGGIASGLGNAGDGVRRTPLVGDSLAAPLGSAGSAANQVADSGQQVGDRLTGAAVPVAVAVAIAGAVPILLPWLLARWRFARRAGSTAAILRRPGGERLLALRAMTNRPVPKLLVLDPDPVAAWERGDPDVTEALAALELRATGLRPSPRVIKQLPRDQATSS
jgi:hypothetical protein